MNEWKIACGSRSIWTLAWKFDDGQGCSRRKVNNAGQRNEARTCLGPLGADGGVLPHRDTKPTVIGQ